MLSEHKEGINLVKWMDSKGLFFSHINHSLFTTDWQALARAKASGTRKGVPDYIILIPAKYRLDGRPLLCFCELKRVSGGTVSKEQKKWLETLNAADVIAFVAKGAAHAIEQLSLLLEKEPDNSEDEFLNYLSCQ